MTQPTDSLDLILFAPNGEQKNISLEKKITIGSHPSNTLCLKDPSIDDYHCVIQQKEDVVIIHNLANDHKMTLIEGFSLGIGKMYLLNPGDRIQIGNYQLLFPLKEAATVPSVPPSFDEEELIDEEIEKELTSDIEKEQTEDEFNLSGLIGRDDLLNSDGDFDEDENKDQEGEGAEGGEQGEEAISDTDQRLLDAIYQGKQPERETTKTSFFTRLFRFKKMVSPKIALQKKELFQRMGLPVPSAFIKIYAFLASLPLAFCAAYTFFPIIGFTAPLKLWLEPWAMMVEEYLQLELSTHPMVLELCYYIATWFIIDFISQISLGSTIPYFLMGIKTNDNELVKRLKAGFRSILGFLTMPFIIFDLPALLGKPTLKEWLVRGKLGYEGNRLIRALGGLIIVPMMMVSSFYMPFTLDPETVAGVNFDRLNAPQSIIGDNLIPQRFAIPTMDFLFEGQLSSNTFILPFFRVERNHLSPAVLISKNADDQFAIFDQPTKVDLIELIDIAKQNDPLFLLKYPNLATQDQSVQWPAKAVEELAEYIDESLTLTPENYHEHFLENGPFITGHLLFRKELLQRFGVWANINASMVKSKDRYFLVLNEVGSARNTNTYYLPLQNKRSSIYRLYYSTDSRKLVYQIEKNLIYPASYLLGSEITLGDQDNNPLFILNLFQNAEMWKNEEAQQLALSIYSQWNIEGRKDLTKKSINSLIKTLKQLYKNEEVDLTSFYDSLAKIIPEEVAPAEGTSAEQVEQGSQDLPAADLQPTESPMPKEE